MVAMHTAVSALELQYYRGYSQAGGKRGPHKGRFSLTAGREEGLLDSHLWDGAVEKIGSQLQSVEAAQRAIRTPSWWDGACRGRQMIVQTLVIHGRRVWGC